MENYALSGALSEAQKEGLKALLLKALEETTGEAEDMIVEYIMVMVENGRTMSSMSAELSTFIAAEHAQELIARLYQHLTAEERSQQQQQQQHGQAQSAAAPASATSKTSARNEEAKKKEETTTAQTKEEKPADAAAAAPKARPQSKIVSLRGSSSAKTEALEKPLSTRREGPSSTAKAIQPASKAAERDKDAKPQAGRLLANAMQASLKSTRETGQKSKHPQQEQKQQLSTPRETRGQRQAATGNKRNPPQQQQQHHRGAEAEGDGSRANKRRKEGGARGHDDQYEIELSDNEAQPAHSGSFMHPPGMPGGPVPMGMMDPAVYYQQQMEEYAHMMGFNSVEEYMEAYQQQMMSMMQGGMPSFPHAPRGRGFRGGRGAPRGRGRGRGPGRAPGPVTASGRNMTWVREPDMESALATRR